jgi:hypothetical protein
MNASASDRQIDGASARALVGLAALFAIDGVVPWERFCGPANLCFHAAIWSGTASLFGFLAEVCAVAFVLISVARRRWSSRLSPTQVALVGAVIASIGVKLGLVLKDAAILLTYENVSRPVYVGAWLGMTLGALMALTLVGYFIEAERSLRRISVIPIVFALISGLAVPYALSGFGWWGGPLSPPRDFGAGAGLGVQARPGHPLPIDGAVYVRNGGWTVATLDGLRLTDADPGLRLVGAYAVQYSTGPCLQGAVRIPQLNECGYPIHGYRVPTTSPGDDLKIVPVLEASGRGRFRARSFQVDYHVGFIHFSVLQVADIEFCATNHGARCHYHY